MAFTLAERQALGIHGLIPPRFKSQEEQVELCVQNLKRYSEDLNKYIYLMGLQVSVLQRSILSRFNISTPETAGICRNILQRDLEVMLLVCRIVTSVCSTASCQSTSRR